MDDPARFTGRLLEFLTTPERQEQEAERLARRNDWLDGFVASSRAQFLETAEHDQERQRWSEHAPALRRAVQAAPHPWLAKLFPQRRAPLLERLDACGWTGGGRRIAHVKDPEPNGPWACLGGTLLIVHPGQDGAPKHYRLSEDEARRIRTRAEQASEAIRAALPPVPSVERLTEQGRAAWQQRWNDLEQARAAWAGMV